MNRRVIRSLEDKVELVLEDSNIFWIKEGRRARNQEELFREYNPSLNENLALLRNYERIGIRQSELAELLKLDVIQLSHYFNKLRPKLHPEKRRKLPIRSAYEILADFMPVVEGWQTSRGVSDELNISTSVVNNYCRGGLIEAKFFLKKYWTSPLGVYKLREFLTMTDPSLSRLKDTAEVANILGVSESSITIHCKKGDVHAEKYGRGWRVPDESVNALKNLIRIREESFDFAGKTYYSLIYVAEQTMKMKGIKDSNEKEKLLKRFYHLRDTYPKHIPSIKKSKVYYVDEETKNLLMDLMTQTEACREIGVNRYIVRSYIDNGALDRIIIGPTNWTTYSSVMRQKSQLS
jgi:hypothetical protein